MEKLSLDCRKVINGKLKAELVFSNKSFSFVGGVNIQNGDVSDYRNENYQKNITGKVFAFPFGKGSTGAGLVLMEMLRLGTAPAAIINIRTDPVILTGPLVCLHFYNQILPVINVSEEDYAKLADGKEIELFENEDYINVYK